LRGFTGLRLHLELDVKMIGRSGFIAHLPVKPAFKIPGEGGERLAINRDLFPRLDVGMAENFGSNFRWLIAARRDR
jgi:hypothetical protein